MKQPNAKPTVQALKRWAHDCRPAAKAVLLARVLADMERERVAAYVHPIFESFHFTASVENQAHGVPAAIANERDLYLTDLDDPLVAVFYAECDDAHRAHGFTGPKGHCPALVAETIRRETERALIDLAVPLFGIESNDVFGDRREKYLELLIGACFAKDSKA